MFSNFTEETCTGTGATMALSGATTGNIPFSESFADGDLVSYVIEDSGGTIKVAGIGTYVSATDDITRNDTWNWNGTAVDKSPATNITLSGGTHTIRCSVPGNSFKTHGALPVEFTNDGSNIFISGEDITGGFTTDGVDGTFIRGAVHSFTKQVDVTAFVCNVTSAATAGALGKVFVYSVERGSTTSNCSSVKLWAETSTFAVDTTGVKVVAHSLTLPSGQYFMGMVTDASATVTSLGGQDGYSPFGMSYNGVSRRSIDTVTPPTCWASGASGSDSDLVNVAFKGSTTVPWIGILGKY